MVAEAERNGLALLRKTRADTAERGKKLLEEAESKAAVRSAEIGKSAEAEAEQLRKSADQHMKEAVDFIVGRVVKH